MKILIVGGGGREHALAWRLAQSPLIERIVAVPGNPGIAQFAECVPSPDAISGYATIAEAYGIDLTVVGPEAPLVAGVVDEFSRRGLQIIGPTQTAARLEGSKIYSKAFLQRAGIPTARTGASIKEFSFPVVIKADGLAAGKGVVIAANENEANQATKQLGPDIVIEEFLEGEEVSFIGISNGDALVPFAPTQDHKRAFNGDQGPNTGGMGAYADAHILTGAQTGDIMDRIMLPALSQMKKEGTPFTGFLYAGLMMTANGPKVLEFNVRLGDPETQALLYSYNGDLAQLLLSMTPGETPISSPPQEGCSVCVVLASEGYPDKPRLGDVITGISEAESGNAIVFQAGVRQTGQQLLTNGGRVLGVTASAPDLHGAITRAYNAVGKIHFSGMHYRTDVGQKGLQRW